ncbi:unnamed protein product [Hermetia illucens]|uniref:Ig-like domain-containing protein n=1 Tax=Hermetia illucens TaxID=343691 RepID=A0A7R8UXL3_HERIL|nr:unnamed protein product [Hermetia illucens]
MSTEILFASPSNLSMLNCIKPTDQQIITQTFYGVEQKTRVLADTSQQSGLGKITNSLEIHQGSGDGDGSSTENDYSANYKSENHGMFHRQYQEDEEESFEQQVEKPHHQHYQQHNLLGEPQVNSIIGKHDSRHKANVRIDSDSVNESLKGHHHSSNHNFVTKYPVQSPATPHQAVEDITIPSELSADVANRAGGVIPRSRTAAPEGRHNKDTSALSISSDLERSTSSDAKTVLKTTESEDDTGNRVRRSVTSDASSYDTAALGRPSSSSSQTKYNSVKTMAAVNGTFAAAIKLHSSNDVSKDKDRSVAFSSGDISKSDIRYNNNNSTLLTHSHYSKTSSVPSMSQSQTSSLSLSSSHSAGMASSLSDSQNGGDVSLVSLVSSPSESRPLSRGGVSENISNSNYRRSRNKDEINDAKLMSEEQIIIIDDGGEEFQTNRLEVDSSDMDSTSANDYVHDEPRALPLRPIIRGPYDDESGEEMTIQYAEQHSEIKMLCEVDLDTTASIWFKNGQIVETVDRNSRPTDYRFIKEPLGGLTIRNVMLEDDGKWQCRASNTNGYEEDARPVKLIVLDRPKAPYLLIDSRRLDAGNIFVPVKENSELNLACISEGGNPKPTLTWEVLLSPGVDHHAQKVAAEVLELEEVKNDKDKGIYKINSGAKSEARLPAVYRAHHNARILCVMEHPTLKMRQNASLLLDVQYTPSFAISRIPGFGYPLREGIEVSLKCDVDSNPPSTPIWQKDDGETPVPQTGDGFLNFTSIRREHSGWYKCSSRHLNFQYSSIGYYLSVRYFTFFRKISLSTTNKKREVEYNLPENMFLRDKLKRRKLNPKAEKFSTPSMVKEPSTSENYYNELAEQDENMDEGEQSATSEAPNPASSTKQIMKRSQFLVVCVTYIPGFSCNPEENKVLNDSVDVTSEPDDQEVSVAASHNPNKGQLEVQLGGAVTLQCPQGSLGCWSHLDPVTARLRGLGVGLNTPTGQFSLKDVVYQDAGTYKCIGQSPTNKKKLEVLQTIGLMDESDVDESLDEAEVESLNESELESVDEFELESLEEFQVGSLEES